VSSNLGQREYFVSNTLVYHLKSCTIQDCMHSDVRFGLYVQLCKMIYYGLTKLSGMTP
jgi:hypothetical protein